MVARNLFKLALLALPVISAVHAEVNVSGDEIIILEAHPYDVLDESQFSPHLVSPSTGYVENQDPGLDNTENAEVATGDLWQRIRAGYALSELKSPTTATHEYWYAKRPDYVNRMMARSQKYLFHIVEEVEKRGMPTEIALLPMVESAYNPTAYSRSGASGIWQFIPSTGKNFGLKQNWWVDNRRDVTAATDAALTYLQKLHVMFGSWELALAAYNAGEGTVMRAIERNRKKGLPTDYQSLDLPAETKNYVPKLQAVKNIVSNPTRFGLEIQPVANQPYFTKVNAPNQIDARLAARLAEISFDEFAALNPEYNRPVLTTTGAKSHEILLPVSAAATFEENLANYDKPLVNWQTYHAKRGERQAAIARKFGISLSQLRDINDLPARSELKQSHQLLVPAAGSGEAAELAVADMSTTPAESPSTVEFSGAAAKRHKVAKGDTLTTIAKRYGLSVKQLLALNSIKPRQLKAGQILNVAPATHVASAKADKTRIAKTTVKTRYTVRRGDTLGGIARKFDVAINDIRRWNKLRGNRINPGDTLEILRTETA